MFLVTGATGKTGSAVLDRLLDRGHRVRVYVRSPEKAPAFAARGAETAIGELEDVDALAAALNGVVGSYLMLPYTPQSTDFIALGQRLVNGYATAVASAGVPRVVGLSSIGAHQHPAAGPMRREELFEAAFADHPDARFVRAAYFVENWGDVLDAARGGVLPTFLRPDAAVSMVSSVDIGTAAADLLATDDPPSPITELAGPVDLSPNELALTLGELLGHEVTATPAPLDQVAVTFQGVGFSEQIAGLVQQMYVAYHDGTLSFEGEPARGATPARETLQHLLARRDPSN